MDLRRALLLGLCSRAQTQIAGLFCRKNGAEEGARLHGNSDGNSSKFTIGNTIGPRTYVDYSRALGSTNPRPQTFADIHRCPRRSGKNSKVPDLSAFLIQRRPRRVVGSREVFAVAFTVTGSPRKQLPSMALYELIERAEALQPRSGSHSGRSLSSLAGGNDSSGLGVPAADELSTCV